ncbi:MAG: hypothetical protein LBE09_03295, partial [Christensenellaceae bacterium]|nr:hypothetical protein [Christensenellaceae bacterium]
LRYLKLNSPTDEILEKIDKFVDEFMREIQYSKLVGYFDICYTSEGVLLNNTNVILQGELVADWLKDCDKIALVVVTLGIKSEQILAKYQRVSAFDYFVADGVATAILEAGVDEVQDGISANASGLGYGITSRFSCGYGDFPLETQKDIFRLLQVEKNIGAHLTDGYMMYPNKTVTAVIGLCKK